MRIAIAHLSTQNFDFIAYGHHNADAQKALRSVFLKHIELSGGSLTWSEVVSDVRFTVAELGKGYVE